MPVHVVEDVNTPHLYSLGNLIDKPGFTIAARFIGNANGGNQFTLGLYSSTEAANTNGWALHFRGGTGDVVRNVRHVSGAQDLGSSSGNAASLTQWNTIVGRSRALTDVDVVLNADFANKGSDATSRALNNLDLFGIGSRYFDSGGSVATSQGLNGSLIAECALWLVALPDGAVTAFNAGMSPRDIRPDALVAYFPLGSHADRANRAPRNFGFTNLKMIYGSDTSLIAGAGLPNQEAVLTDYITEARDAILYHKHMVHPVVPVYDYGG